MLHFSLLQLFAGLNRHSFWIKLSFHLSVDWKTTLAFLFSRAVDIIPSFRLLYNRFESTQSYCHIFYYFRIFVKFDETFFVLYKTIISSHVFLQQFLRMRHYYSYNKLLHSTREVDIIDHIQSNRQYEENSPDLKEANIANAKES